MTYDFDIVIRLTTAKDLKTKQEIYKGEIIKDRTGVFNKGDIIDNPSYEYWREMVEGKQNLKENVVDFNKAIDKDAEKLRSEGEELEDVLEEFKVVLKGLKDKSKIAPYCKEIGVDNPLKCTDLDKMKLLLNFTKSL